MSDRSIFSRGNDVVEVMTRDQTGRRLEKFRTNADDTFELAKIFQSIIDKYGLDLTIVIGKSLGKVQPWMEADEEFKW